MPLSPQEIDKVFSDLLSAIRVEKNSKRVRKIDARFYEMFREAYATLSQEAEKQASQDIDKYLQIKERIRKFETEFRTFFQLRFSKISRLSVYQIDEEDLEMLTESERKYLKELRSRTQDEFMILSRGEIPKPALEIREKEPEKIEIPMQKASAEKESYVLVRIIGDQPPIAQPDRNYYFRDNDLVHLNRKFADLLIKRKSAIEANIRA